MCIKLNKIIPLCIICCTALIFLCSSAFSDTGRRNEKATEQIRETLGNLTTVQEKIEYLEELLDENHFIYYTLASLYLQKGEIEKSEYLLKKDLRKNRDPAQAYESYCLLVGLAIDQKRALPDNDIRRYTRLFQKMKRVAQKKGKNISGAAADPFKFERMMGDYFFYRGDTERAYSYYQNYYANLDKPAGSFNPDSMRHYVDILLQKGSIQEALVYMGYVINLRPYMFNDLFDFSELYYRLNDRTSSLLSLMFINTLAEGYSSRYGEMSRNLIEERILELKQYAQGQTLAWLATVYLTGENITSLPVLIDALKKGGAEHFYFYYLEGVSSFVSGDYAEALEGFSAFNRIYPYLADSYYYTLVCEYSLSPSEYSEDIIRCAEQVIALKPDSTLAKPTKLYLGNLLGLSRNESELLLVSSEIETILGGFLNYGAPAWSLDPLSALLTVSKNPYQTAAVRLMAGVESRKEELLLYLRGMHAVVNDRGRRNIEQILEEMGAPLDVPLNLPLD